jgi:hypothetical protein
MSRHRGRRFVLLLVLLAAGAAASGYVWIRSPRSPGARERTVIEFPIGTPTRRIFRTLAERGIVRQAFLAEAYYASSATGSPFVRASIPSRRETGSTARSTSSRRARSCAIPSSSPRG